MPLPFAVWSHLSGLNWRPARYECAALPTELKWLWDCKYIIFSISNGIISENNMYATFFKNKIVAKAAVNAVGKNCVQLGGVFTVPNFRKLGFAEFLIKKIVAEKNQLGKKVVLFVKPKNLAAVTLYKRCGFSSFGKFKISYY